MIRAPKAPATALLVDLGNTNLKWACWEAGVRGPVRSAPHRDIQPSVLLDSCWAGEPVPARVLVANVAGPALDDALQRWIAARWGLTPSFLRSGPVLLGVRNGYREPARLGIDRLLAMAAVYRRLGAACIVDCGSAITLDALDSAGRHLGGLILPGFAMMRWAIQRYTAIGHLEDTAALELLARDTVTAVASAPVHAAAALIERVLDRLGEQGGSPALVLTGSGSERLVPALESDFQVMEHLVIEGLALLAAK